MSSSDHARAFQSVIDAVSDAVIVDDQVLETILIGALARGHVLLEDVPGTGKTLTAKSFATALGLSFNRIQFTPDLLPADVTGTEIFDEHQRGFEFKEGPLFANIVLADEINRASPKTQSALLEAMEERQVTVGGQVHELPRPFFVIATQNPVETGEGTFPLPEAQKDRFILKTQLGYPDRRGEREILDRRESRRARAPSVQRVLSPQQLLELQDATENLRCHPDVKQYIVDMVHATREDERVRVGVSPRGTQRLFEIARSRAVAAGRHYIIPHDVKTDATSTLAHRIVLTPDARVDNVTKSQVIEDILDDVPAPTVSREEPVSERATPPGGR